MQDRIRVLKSGKLSEIGKGRRPLMDIERDETDTMEVNEDHMQGYIRDHAPLHKVPATTATEF